LAATDATAPAAISSMKSACFCIVASDELCKMWGSTDSNMVRINFLDSRCCNTAQSQRPLAPLQVIVPRIFKRCHGSTIQHL
jgi:hypothetical protein